MHFEYNFHGLSGKKKFFGGYLRILKFYFFSEASDFANQNNTEKFY